MIALRHLPTLLNVDVLIYFVVGYNKFRFVFANTAVADSFAVLIFTNTKISKQLRRQVHRWDTLQGFAMKQAVEREKKVTKTLLIKVSW